MVGLFMPPCRTLLTKVDLSELVKDLAYVEKIFDTELVSPIPVSRGISITLSLHSPAPLFSATCRHHLYPTFSIRLTTA